MPIASERLGKAKGLTQEGAAVCVVSTQPKATGGTPLYEGLAWPHERGEETSKNSHHRDSLLAAKKLSAIPRPPPLLEAYVLWIIANWEVTGNFDGSSNLPSIEGAQRRGLTLEKFLNERAANG